LGVITLLIETNKISSNEINNKNLKLLSENEKKVQNKFVRIKNI
jgi:hypothetical protein